MTTNIISALGAGSGIDVKSLVSQLTEIERAPRQTRLDSQKATLETQISAYGLMKSALSEFQSVLAPLSKSDTFKARSVSFPDTDVITPTKLDPNAQVGTYQIEVIDVAQSQSLASSVVADPDAALGAGELTISFGSWDSYTELGGPVGFNLNADKDALTLTIEAGDSVNDIAKKINESEIGVQASILKTDGQYQLLLTSPSGENNAIQLSLSPTSDASLDFLSFEEGDANLLQNQAGSDASLKVNGLLVTRDSNEIDDMIEGLSFSVNKSSNGDKFTFSISEDKDTGKQAIEDFVEAYNTLYDTMKNLLSNSTGDEEDETFKGGLHNDGTAKSILSQMRQMVTGSVGGLSSYDALTHVGIRTALDGTLEINEKDFDAAIKDNFQQVAKLFSPDVSSDSGYVDVGYGSAIKYTKAGSYTLNVTQEPAKGSIASNVIANLDASVGGPYDFTIKVDGVESASISLTEQVYGSGDELAAQLQSLINADSNLTEAHVGINAVYDSGTNKITFESREYGSSSKVSFTAATANLANFGIETSLVGTSGKDAAGTLNGTAAFGTGTVLLPEIDTDPYGLTLNVFPGSSGSSTITFSRGLAGEFSLLLDNFLSNTGSIKTREESINRQLSTIDTKTESLDRRMEKYEARLLVQFTAMESIVSSLQTTGDSFSGILDRLPFTATKN